MKNLHNLCLEILIWIGAWFGWRAYCNTYNTPQLVRSIGIIVIFIILMRVVFTRE